MPSKRRNAALKLVLDANDKGFDMPITGTELIISTVFLIGLPLSVMLLNKYRRRWGWTFLGIVGAIFFVGALIENIISK